MSSKTIRAEWPAKGDFVAGHRAAAVFPGLPAVRGCIANVPDGASVIFAIDPVLAAFGLPRRSRWTWRPSVRAYQQAGQRTRKASGLVLLRQ